MKMSVSIFLYGYLFKIFTSETAAKDIRLYGMQGLSLWKK